MIQWFLINSRASVGYVPPQLYYFFLFSVSCCTLIDSCCSLGSSLGLGLWQLFTHFVVVLFLCFICDCFDKVSSNDIHFWLPRALFFMIFVFLGQSLSSGQVGLHAVCTFSLWTWMISLSSVRYGLSCAFAGDFTFNAWVGRLGFLELHAWHVSVCMSACVCAYQFTI